MVFSKLKDWKKAKECRNQMLKLCPMYKDNKVFVRMNDYLPLEISGLY